MALNLHKSNKLKDLELLSTTILLYGVPSRSTTTHFIRTGKSHTMGKQAEVETFI